VRRKRRYRNYHIDQLLVPEVEFVHVKQAIYESLLVTVVKFRAEHGPEKLEKAGIGSRLHYARHPDGSITIWKKPFASAPKPLPLPKKEEAHFVMENPQLYDDLFVKPAIKTKVEKARKVQKTHSKKTIQEIVRTPIYEGPREPSDIRTKKPMAQDDTDAFEGLLDGILFE